MKRRMLTEALLASCCLVYFTGCKLGPFQLSGSGQTGSGTSASVAPGQASNSGSNCPPPLPPVNSTGTSVTSFSNQCVEVVDVPESSPGWYVWPVLAVGAGLALNRRAKGLFKQRVL